jgi:hypothetical protein
MGGACSSTLNRRMRTRTYGGVGRVVSNDRPYPISSIYGLHLAWFELELAVSVVSTKNINDA